ncbi:MAG: TlpA family protein disulfide reductase [Chloroflexi bacterium]|nr:TlpA family protein disulfide reductase [Chloroflexota bacterium]
MSPNPSKSTQRFSPELLIFLGLPVLGVIIAAVTLSRERAADVLTDDLLEARWYAEDFVLPTLTGDTLQLSDYRGQVVFVNFWETTCAGCVRELPAFEQFVSEQGAAGAAIIAVNGRESHEQVGTFLNDLGVDRLTIALDTDLAVRQAYGVVALPTTIVIDADGFIRTLKFGELTLSDLRDLARALGT